MKNGKKDARTPRLICLVAANLLKLTGIKKHIEHWCRASHYREDEANEVSDDPIERLRQRLSPEPPRVIRSEVDRFDAELERRIAEEQPDGCIDKAVTVNAVPEDGQPDATSAWTSSPLQNKEWTSLVEECTEMMDDFERMQTDLDDAGREVAEMAVSRLQELLERRGVDLIADERAFDLKRHKPVPMREVPEGTTIEETLAPGLCVGNRVFRRAQVRVKWEQG